MGAVSTAPLSPTSHMYPTGHYGVSLTLYAPVLAGLFLFELSFLAMLGLGIMLYTAPLPDIDLKKPFSYFMGHRTWTHTLWFALLVGSITGALMIPLGPLMGEHSGMTMFYFGLAMGVYGVFGHLAGDILTHSGVRPLYPVGPRYTVNLTTAKGLWWFENPKSGSQEDLTLLETIRHLILNSNRIFLVIGLLSCGLASTLYVGTI